MTPESVLQAVRDTIKTVDLCFLITNSESGHASARLMQPFPIKDDFTIWFGTRDISRKVEEIRKDRNVAVAFQNLEEGAYVTFSGVASIIDDPALRRQYWRPEWTAFFPFGPDDGYVLIKVVPHEIEILNFRQEITPQPFGVQPAYLFRVGESWSFNQSVERSDDTI